MTGLTLAGCEYYPEKTAFVRVHASETGRITDVGSDPAVHDAPETAQPEIVAPEQNPANNGSEAGALTDLTPGAHTYV